MYTPGGYYKNTKRFGGYRVGYEHGETRSAHSERANIPVRKSPGKSPFFPSPPPPGKTEIRRVIDDDVRRFVRSTRTSITSDSVARVRIIRSAVVYFNLHGFRQRVKNCDCITRRERYTRAYIKLKKNLPFFFFYFLYVYKRATRLKN